MFFLHMDTTQSTYGHGPRSLPPLRGDVPYLLFLRLVLSTVLGFPITLPILYFVMMYHKPGFVLSTAPVYKFIQKKKRKESDCETLPVASESLDPGMA